MDRTRRLLDDLKVAEARSDGMPIWSEPARRVRREVRRLRVDWETSRASRFGGSPVDDAEFDGESA